MFGLSSGETDIKNKYRFGSEALSKLPPDVAYAVAHGNAESLWKLK